MGVEDEPRDDHGRWTSGAPTPVGDVHQAIRELGGLQRGPGSGTAGTSYSSVAVWNETAQSPSFGTVEEANSFLEDRGKEGSDAVSPLGYPRAIDEAEAEARQEENHAVGMYTGAGAQTMNNMLRGKESYTTSQYHEAYDPIVQRLDEAIDRQVSTSADTVLYRGIQGDAAPDYTAMEPGDSFTEPGFMSATTKESSAEGGFAGRDAEGNPYSPGVKSQLLEIRVPAGSQGYSVNAVQALNKGPSGVGTQSAEAEVILPRSSEFEVLEQLPDRTVLVHEPR